MRQVAQILANKLTPTVAGIVLIVLAVLKFWPRADSQDETASSDIIDKLIVGGIITIALLLVFSFGLMNKEARRQKQERRAIATRLATQVSLNSMGEAIRIGLESNQLRTDEGDPFVWSRLVPRWPFEPDVSSSVLDLLKGLRSFVHEELKAYIAHQTSIPLDHVRTNIFLPETRDARNGDVCTLKIPHDPVLAPEGLQAGMQREKERTLAFRPNDGSTGRVFVEQRPGGAQRDDQGEWRYVPLTPGEVGEFDFLLNQFQDQRIDKKLAWVISIPLFVPDGQGDSVIGVLNIDCLEERISPEQMRRVYSRITDARKDTAIANLLAGVKKDRVGIILVEVPENA